MNKYMKRSLLVAGVLTAFSAVAYGATPVDADTNGDASVTVTATRTEQLVKNVPADTYIITQKDIQEHQYKDLQEALLMVPGAQFSNDPHGGLNISLRGADPRFVLILIDGQRVPNELTKSRANYTAFKRINMNDVERIEVVNGSSSALYGSEAMGGVINIITKKNQKTSGGVVSYEVTNRKNTPKNGYTASVGYHTGWQNNWNLNLYAEKNNHVSTVIDGYQATYDGPRTPLHVDVAYKVSDNDTLNFSWDHTYEDLTQKGFGMGPSSVSTKQITTNMYALQYKGQHGNSDYKLRLYKSHYNDFYVMTMPMGPHFTYHGWDKTERNDKGITLQVNTAANEQNLFTYGFTYRSDEGIGTRVKSDDKAFTETHFNVPRTASKVKLNTKSIYIQDMFTSNDEKLIFVPAIRYDKPNKFDGRLSPKVGITYKVQPDLRIKANYGSGYSIPGFTEMYHYWEMYGPMPKRDDDGNIVMDPESHRPEMAPGFFFQGNPDLKPETSKSFDISVEKDFDRSTMKLTYFHNAIDDYIEITPIIIGFDPVKRAPKFLTRPARGGVDNIFTYKNRKDITLQGVTWEGKYVLNDQWDLNANFTYLDATEAGSKAMLEGKARKLFSLGINFHNDGWAASLWGNEMMDYVSYNEDGIKKYSNYSLWNFLVSKEFNNKASVYFGIDNVFAKNYSIRDQDGRKYRFGFSYKF